MIDNRFIKFIIVGVINTLFGYSIYALFILLNFHYSIAALLANIIGVLFNFKTIGKIVFKNYDNALIFKFIGVYIVTYFLNVGFLKILDMFMVDMFLAGAVLVLPMAVISFILNKKFVFKEQEINETH